MPTLLLERPMVPRKERQMAIYKAWVDRQTKRSKRSLLPDVITSYNILQKKKTVDFRLAPKAPDFGRCEIGRNQPVQYSATTALASVCVATPTLHCLVGLGV
jgi:hypothetical protein